MISLLHSRKFWLLVFGVVQTIVQHYFNIEPEVWMSINALVMFLIGSIAIEDAARWKSGQVDENLKKGGKDG